MALKPYSDQPRIPSDLDFVGIADGVSKLLLAGLDDKLTFGVFGRYGSGKTTLMLEIQDSVRQAAGGRTRREGELLTVWFQPWRFEREEPLVVPFLMTLRQAITKGNPGHAAWRRFNLACRAVLQGFSFEFGVGSTKAKWSANDSSEALRSLESNVAEEARRYTDLVSYLQEVTTQDDGPKHVVAFIDDLDRCVPSKAFPLLEALKTMLEIEGFTYVVGLDHRVIGTYLATKFCEGHEFVTAEEYLEKMFPIQVAVPEPTAEGMLRVLRGLVGQMPEAWRPGLDAVLPHFPPNVRQSKRILNRYLGIRSSSHGVVRPGPEGAADAPLLLALLVVAQRWPGLIGKVSADGWDALEDVPDANGLHTALIELGAPVRDPTVMGRLLAVLGSADGMGDEAPTKEVRCADCPRDVPGS
jgi:hypothetical protein